MNMKIKKKKWLNKFRKFQNIKKPEGNKKIKSIHWNNK